MKNLTTTLILIVGFAAPSLAREFTDATGRKIEAELVSVKDDDVTINRAGREFTLPIAKFSDADQTYIREWAKEQMAKPAAADDMPTPEGPKPGETLTFDFPNLAKDFSGNPAKFSAKIPADYDPAKPVGLIVFAGGGKGSSSPSGAAGLTNGDFVCAGFPYPDNGRNPAQNNMVGSFDEVWDYWKPMLAKLEEAVPNIDPRLRIIGGFSNGGHAIDGLLSEKEFSASFNAFVLIDGGGALGGNYRDVADKHAYIAWGSKSPARANSENVVKRAKRGRMVVVENEMEGVGHAFPGEEKAAVKKWIYETVIPALSSKN